LKISNLLPTQTVLRRFLKARQYVVSAAADMLRNYYAWRKAQGALLGAIFDTTVPV
jgi:hypothetical protein